MHRLYSLVEYFWGRDCFTFIDILATIDPSLLGKRSAHERQQLPGLFQQQLLLSDPEERAACFHEIAELISEDVPWIPLYNKAGLIGLSNRVQDYVCDFRGAFFQIEKWNIAE